MSRARPLIGICEGCGRSDGVPQPHFDTVYCPDCAATNGDYEPSRTHLFGLTAPFVAAWHVHWLARGMTPELLEELVDNTDELADTVRALNTKASAGNGGDVRARRLTGPVRQKAP